VVTAHWHGWLPFAGQRLLLQLNMRVGYIRGLPRATTARKSRRYGSGVTESDEIPTTHISPEMTAAIGREFGRRQAFPISESDIRKWAIAVYYPEDPPRIFWDAAYAASTVHGGIVAPEEFNPFAWMAADPPGIRHGGYQGIEASLGVDPPNTGFILNGGLEVTYGERMRPGDVITSVSTLTGYHERRGRLGLMLFSTQTDRWTNQKDQLVKVSEMTLIRY
jgi:hypothetical protein